MELQLRDKVTVITGPAKGMGRAVTLAFAQEGARLVLAGRDVDAIEPVAREARDGGAQVIVVRCDLTDAQQTEALAQQALAAFGRIDILVNVAGGSGPIGKTGWQTSTQEFNDIVQLNMTGCFNTMHAVLPAMIAQRSGKVVNVGGTFGMRGRAGRAAYSASKWGLRRHHQELRARSRAVQHQRQLRRTRHGRRSALSRQGLRRHGRQARHQPRRGDDAARGRLCVETRVDRCRRRQRLSVSGQRREPTDHRRRSAGGRRLGHALKKGNKK